MSALLLLMYSSYDTCISGGVVDNDPTIIA